MLPPDWRQVFLVEYARTGKILVAAELAVVDRTTIWRARRREPAFAAEMDCAYGRWLAGKRRLVARKFGYTFTPSRDLS